MEKRHECTVWDVKWRFALLDIVVGCFFVAILCKNLKCNLKQDVARGSLLDVDV